MTLLLDTNVVIWLVLGQRRSIPDDVAESLGNPGETVLVSAASVWEIAIKRSLGRLTIGDNWHTALMDLDLNHLQVSATHAVGVEALPWHHRDPFDRILVAQAIAEEAVLVTADRMLDAYPVRTWWGGQPPR